VETRVLYQPCVHVGVLVGGVSVHDEVNREVLRDPTVEATRELEKLLVTVTRQALADHGDARSCATIMVSASPSDSTNNALARAFSRCGAVWDLKSRQDRSLALIELQPWGRWTQRSRLQTPLPYEARQWAAFDRCSAGDISVSRMGEPLCDRHGPPGERRQLAVRRRTRG